MTAFLPTAVFYLHDANPDLVADLLERAGAIKWTSPHGPPSWDGPATRGALRLSFHTHPWKPLSDEAQFDLEQLVLDSYFALRQALGREPSLVVGVTLYHEQDATDAVLPVAVALLTRFDGLMHYIPNQRNAWKFFDPSLACTSGDLRADPQAVHRIITRELSPQAAT